MKLYPGILAGAAFALSAVAGAAAYAQATSGPEAQPRTEHHGQRALVIRGGDVGADRAEHLRAILQLRPGQEAALSAYLAAMHPPHDRERMMRMYGEGTARTTPDRLARMEARMAERDTAMKARIAATKRFYDQLDPGQKRAFDELPLMMGGAQMPMMGGMKIMHHPRPPMPPMAPTPPAPPRS